MYPLGHWLLAQIPGSYKRSGTDTDKLARVHEEAPSAEHGGTRIDPVILACFYVAAYVLGGVPFGLLIAKSQGVDLTKVGSGNIGATNVLRALGPKAGIPAFVLDIAKGAAPPMAFKFLMRDQLRPDQLADHAVLVGMMAVLGHSFSPFLRFKGGKSVATGLGALLGTAPIVGLVGFAAFLVLYGLTAYVSLGSLVACVTVVTMSFVTDQNLMFKVVYGLMCVFVVIRHKPNIDRLLKGEEPKTPFLKKSGKQAKEADRP